MSLLRRHCRATATPLPLVHQLDRSTILLHHFRWFIGFTNQPLLHPRVNQHHCYTTAFTGPLVHLQITATPPPSPVRLFDSLHQLTVASINRLSLHVSPCLRSANALVNITIPQFCPPYGSCHVLSLYKAITCSM